MSPVKLFLLLLSSFSAQPNVLFIAVDDLNDWIGCLGGHPQTKTPNFDRLAKSGVLFTNAYCASASCNPSRTAVFSGRPPHRSGLYHNMQKMREVMPEAEPEQAQKLAEMRSLVPKEIAPVLHRSR